MEVTWKGQVRILLFLFITKKVQSQNFIFDCNDQGADYCSRACALADAGLPDASLCNADGLCTCNYPCDFPVFLQSTLCPIATDPPFPDPTGPQLCADACATVCAGAGSLICGLDMPQGADGMTYSKICTCYCPPEPCPVTTTVAPATTTPSAVALPGFLPNLIGLIASSVVVNGIKGNLLKLASKKIFTLGGIFAKVSGLYIFKCLLMLLFYLVLHLWFDSQFGDFLGLTRSEGENNRGWGYQNSTRQLQRLNNRSFLNLRSGT